MLLKVPAAAATAGIVTGLSGTNYTVDSNGFVNVTVAGDLGPLLAAGFLDALPFGTSQNMNATNGLAPLTVSLVDALSDAGVPLTATPTGGAFGIAMTAGAAGSIGLKSESGKGSTATDKADFVVTLPPNYIAATDLTVRVNANSVKGSGTISTQTIDVVATEVGSDGKLGADLVSTAAQTITGTAADYDFTVDGKDLVPGDRLVLQVTEVVTETGGAAASYGTVNAVSVR